MENILQIFSMEKKSRTLLVRSGSSEGILDISDGRLINAEQNGLKGLEAAKTVLSWDTVKVEMVKLRNGPRTIDMSTIALLFEAAKYKDEQKESSAAGQLNRLRETAIESAELRLYDKGFKLLSEYLKKNKYDVEAWVWFARVSGKLEVIQKALRMAGKIDARNSLFLEERKKVALSLPSLRGEALGKCIFCWAPMNKTDPRCPYCLGYQGVSAMSLSDSGTAREDMLNVSQRRYESLLERRPGNIFLCYALALIHVNKGAFSEALVYFDKITRFAPDKVAFSKQFELLLGYLAQSSGQKVQEKEALTTGNVEMASVVDEDNSSKSTKILVVEDSSTTRKVITITLKRNGYEVVEAADGLEALTKVSETHPDLILLDVMLPKMDGYEILSILRNNPEFKTIPVIMLTSKDGFINKMKGKIAGSAAYLTKPFDPEKMINEIKKHL